MADRITQLEERVAKQTEVEGLRDRTDIAADRLRPRLVAEALPTAGPVGGLVLFLLQLPHISSILPILAVTSTSSQ